MAIAMAYRLITCALFVAFERRSKIVSQLTHAQTEQAPSTKRAAPMAAYEWSIGNTTTDAAYPTSAHVSTRLPPNLETSFPDGIASSTMPDANQTASSPIA